jgi:hypothetical protein
MKVLWNKKEKKNAHYMCQQIAEIVGKVESYNNLPMIFISVVENLEVFACFVKNRLRKLHGIKRKDINGDTDFENYRLKGTAYEVCCNWLYFTNNVRDIYARSYIKTSTFFLTVLRRTTPMRIEILRLAFTLNGIRDPIHYSYAASYLLFTVGKYNTADADFLIVMMHHFLEKITVEYFQKHYASLNPFFTIYFQIFSQKASEKETEKILKLSQEHKNGGIILFRVIGNFSQDQISKDLPQLLRSYNKFDPKLKVSLYSELISSLKKFKLNDKQIDMLLEICLNIEQFDKFIEGLPHIFPIINKHSDSNQSKTYSALIFEKLNSLVVSNAQGKKRFEEIDKVFAKLTTSGTNLSDLLNLKPFLNI